jgi:hypothetical protein
LAPLAEVVAVKFYSTQCIPSHGVDLKFPEIVLRATEALQHFHHLAHSYIGCFGTSTTYQTLNRGFFIRLTASETSQAQFP